MQSKGQPSAGQADAAGVVCVEVRGVTRISLQLRLGELLRAEARAVVLVLLGYCTCGGLLIDEPCGNASIAIRSTHALLAATVAFNATRQNRASSKPVSTTLRNRLSGDTFVASIILG